MSSAVPSALALRMAATIHSGGYPAGVARCPEGIASAVRQDRADLAAFIDAELQPALDLLSRWAGIAAHAELREALRAALRPHELATLDDLIAKTREAVRS